MKRSQLNVMARDAARCFEKHGWVLPPGVLFEPTERKSLAAFSATKNYFLINELDNIRSRLYVMAHKDGKWTREPLKGAPEIGT